MNTSPNPITKIETFTVSAGWKNWLFVKVWTKSGQYGIGEATINGFIKTTEAAVHELAHFVIGKDASQVNAIAHAIMTPIQDAGHIHRLAAGAVEVACWDSEAYKRNPQPIRLFGSGVRFVEGVEDYKKSPQHL